MALVAHTSPPGPDTSQKGSHPSIPLHPPLLTTTHTVTGLAGILPPTFHCLIVFMMKKTAKPFLPQIPRVWAGPDLPQIVPAHRNSSFSNTQGRNSSHCRRVGASIGSCRHVQALSPNLLNLSASCWPGQRASGPGLWGSTSSCLAWLILWLPPPFFLLLFLLSQAFSLPSKCLSFPDSCDFRSCPGLTLDSPLLPRSPLPISEHPGFRSLL